MRVFQYRPREGLYARLDERARVLFAVCGVVATLATWDPRPLAVFAAIGVALVPLARIRWEEIRRFAFFAAFVVALLVFFTWLTHGGSPEERRAHALAQSLRMVALIAFTAVLPFTIEPPRWGVTFRRLGLPDSLAFAVELSVRFVPTFAERFERTVQAQAARGLDTSARVGPVRRLRRLVPILVPVLLDVIVSGEDVADAMDLRAFGARRRTWTGSSRFGAAECGVLLVGLAMVGTAAALALA